MKNIIKKIFVVLAVIASVSVVTSINHNQPVYAGSLGSCDEFLGMKPWYCGVDDNPSSPEALKSNAQQIALNIMEDIATIATYLVIGFVIFGGYLYMFSYGDPVKAANGKKTITRAFIGLAITMLAKVILGAMHAALGESFGEGVNCATQECISGDELVRSAIDWFIGMAGIVAAIFIVVGGWGYMTSQGDPGKLQKAKATLIYALIGLLIVALSRAITVFVFNIINDSSESALDSSLVVAHQSNEPIAKKHNA